MTQDKLKVRDIPPTVLRLHPDVRAELQRLAFAHSRSLSNEISIRLQASLKADKQSGHYSPTEPAAMPSAQDPQPANSPFALADHDRALLALFRQLPPEKQLALLTLLRPNT